MSVKREIILDTETTGFDPIQGDRIVEIGCIEVLNLVPSGKQLHLYINPEREVPAEAVAVHGITTEFLKDKPLFIDIAEELVEFIGDAPIVAHNAPFDIKFINWELSRCGYKPYEDAQVIDTLPMARRQAPGAPATLDALCRRYNIDNSNRTLHGALLDAELLAEVYLELRGGRQTGLALGDQDDDNVSAINQADRKLHPARPHAPSEEELAAHENFLKEIKNALWTRQSQN